MEAIQQEMVEVKKSESAKVLQEVKCLCNGFGFTACMLTGLLSRGGKTKEKLPSHILIDY